MLGGILPGHHCVDAHKVLSLATKTQMGGAAYVLFYGAVIW
jgi:hypothetical protein